ncbi:Hypothetical predicted protein [Mytilus galloprovincialis]|uniref:Reverse transcriptase/retrotransposon-derived protein RNase H-like domain-containing protein n=1 Tax=Mytilus galloprovincialis TaxID=29158 RepID=A0A8B6GC51_MYTGA|nr:Hypothetical predicted protein [Mytilus galloprovincialis]
MSKQKKKVDAIQYDYYDSEDELFIGTVSVDSVQQCEEWKESMSINNQSVVFKLDTGAQANIISEKLFRKLSLPDNRTEKTNIKLVTYDGHKISPIGTRMLKCTFKDRTYNLKFFIVPTDSQPILSADTCSEIGAIVRVRAVDKPLTKEEVISDYGETFKGLGDIQWHWDHEQHQSFEELKQLVSSAPVLRFYNVNEPVTISVDASSKGLGVVKINSSWHTDPELSSRRQSRYVQIEREMLAILYVLRKV